MLTLFFPSFVFFLMVVLDDVLSLFSDGTQVRYETLQPEVRDMNGCYVFFFETLLDPLLETNLSMSFEVLYCLAGYLVPLLIR